MTAFDNGGANAIKGFNYQKSVVVLIAIQNYVDDEQFRIYVEAEDDIVVTAKDETTYIQVKSEALSVKSITNKPEGKDSIIEKNLANGGDNCYYKLVTPQFAGTDKNLAEATARLFHNGATEYEYTEDGKEAIKLVLKTLPDDKLDRSRVALTAFKANHIDASTYVIGVMTEQGILVDNNYGRAALDEFIRQIDRKSEIKIKNPDDKTLKLFTKENLSTIFTHSDKMQFFDKLIDKLGYSTYNQMLVQRHRLNIGALYSSIHKDAREFISAQDLKTMSETDVMAACLSSVNFSDINDELIRKTIVLDAYSQIIFERSKG